jgi:MerR family transcriptional regulator, mercuric resistance operon regulatory protein
MRQITASRAKTSEGIPIGELSRLTGVNIETIRYYEKIKMLPVPLRTGGGHRVYGPTETRTLAFIRRSRELGFAIDEIRSLLALGAPGNHSGHSRCRANQTASQPGMKRIPFTPPVAPPSRPNACR